MSVSPADNFYSSWTADTAADYKINKVIQLDGIQFNPGDVFPMDHAVHQDGAMLRRLLRAGQICYASEYGLNDWQMTR
jgi:hypothetical protein